MSEETIYETRDGVRRAKAAWLCGRESISAQIRAIGEVIEVSLANLRSLEKDEISLEGMSGFRWQRTLRGTQAGLILPPIIIELGTRGVTIEEVKVPDDEFNLFR